MDDDDVSEASEAASELTADDVTSPVKPLRALSKTSTRGRLQAMAFEDVLTVPTPLEPPCGRKIPLLQCFLERKKSTFGSGELTLKFEDKTLLVAKKTSRSGNYHIFDATRGRIGGGFSKKGGNYLGKIMAPKGSGVDLGGGSAHHRVLVDGSQQKNEHALFIHKRTSTLTSFVDGAKPRQVSVALPGSSTKSDLLTRFSHSDEKLTVLEQRQPKLVDGQYSLNFYGRATVASVKNFQLVPGINDDTVVFQLGKVGDHDFNLDFAPPFTPFSAFALAVSQF
jgi:tubby-related protein 1